MNELKSHQWIGDMHNANFYSTLRSHTDQKVMRGNDKEMLLACLLFSAYSRLLDTHYELYHRVTMLEGRVADLENGR